MGTLKLIVVNVLVLIALLAMIEMASSIAMDYYRIKYESDNTCGVPLDSSSLDRRVFLDNYQSYDWAAEYWHEFRHCIRGSYASYVGFISKPYSGQFTSIDEQGFRVSSGPKGDSLPEKLTAFLGGSTMWGLGSPDSLTIPSLTSQMIGIESLNMGQPSYSAYQSAMLLQLMIAQGFRPDHVITYDGVNNSPVSHGHFTHRRQEYFAALIEKPPVQEHFFMYSTRTLLSGNLKSKFLYRDRPPREHTFPTNEEAAIELAESWMVMKTTCDRFGIDFTCILQPVAYYGDPDINNLDGHPKNTFDEYGKSGYVYYDIVLDLLEQEPYTQLKPHFLNLTGAYDQMPNTYFDWCHVTPNGNQKIAGLIAGHLKNKQLRKQ